MLAKHHATQGGFGLESPEYTFPPDAIPHSQTCFSKIRISTKNRANRMRFRVQGAAHNHDLYHVTQGALCATACAALRSRRFACITGPSGTRCLKHVVRPPFADTYKGARKAANSMHFWPIIGLLRLEAQPGSRDRLNECPSKPHMLSLPHAEKQSYIQMDLWPKDTPEIIYLQCFLVC